MAPSPPINRLYSVYPLAPVVSSFPSPCRASVPSQQVRSFLLCASFLFLPSSSFVLRSFLVLALPSPFGLALYPGLGLSSSVVSFLLPPSLTAIFRPFFLFFFHFLLNNLPFEPAAVFPGGTTEPDPLHVVFCYFPRSLFSFCLPGVNPESVGVCACVPCRPGCQYRGCKRVYRLFQSHQPVQLNLPNRINKPRAARGSVRFECDNTVDSITERRLHGEFAAAGPAGEI